MKALVVRGLRKSWKSEHSEILDLARAAGYIITLEIEIDMQKTHPVHFLPQQKYAELKDAVKLEGFERIIIDASLTPQQSNTIEEDTDVEVLDKVLLVLEIFDQRANSKEIQLQVQLAYLKYQLPRMLERMGEAVIDEKQGYWGSGEAITSTFISDMRRRIARIQQNLEEIMRKRRDDQKQDHPVLPIIGHYSAGKSTLFNILTGLSREMGKEAFTTMFLKRARAPDFGYRLDVVDTIGLVDLPQSVLNAFNIMLSSIFAYRGFIICLDSSLPVDILEEQLAYIHESILRFANHREAGEIRYIVVLSKIDLTDQHHLDKFTTLLENTRWLVNYQLVYSSMMGAEQTRKDMIDAFETLFHRELEFFKFQHIPVDIAAKLHELSRIDSQSWHEDGSTTLVGVGLRTQLKEYRKKLGGILL